MARARVFTTEALVLRRTDFGEADRILTLFTPAQGKLRAVAKGSRRTSSRLAGHLEPFTRTNLLLAQGRDLAIVTQAEGRERWDALRQDLWHASAAWYTLELVDRFLEDADPHPRLYQLLLQTLRELAGNAEQTHGAPEAAPVAQGRSWLALRYFELHLLDELGYRPNLQTCTNCDTPLRPEENGYSAELGGALCPTCLHLAARHISLPALKVLRLLQRTPWSDLPQLRLEYALHTEMEAVLQTTLRYHLDRDLSSWAFLQRAAAPH